MTSRVILPLTRQNVRREPMRGYQVCMWCWHRIRESETGLCPACRTPYGEDPHAFSAVDVEEVLKANREKERLQQRQGESVGRNEQYNCRD